MQPKLKIGKQYKIIANIHDHDFEIGETVTIDSYNDGGDDYIASANGRWWYIRAEEVEAIPLAPVKEETQTFTLTREQLKDLIEDAREIDPGTNGELSTYEYTVEQLINSIKRKEQ